MLHQIQDDIIRRALDFLGLRGIVTHDYESTVLPIVSIGNLSQPTLARQFNAVTDGAPIATVPVGESWRLHSIRMSHTQTAGAVQVQTILIAQLPGPTTLYSFPGITDVSTAQETLKLILTLNGSNNIDFKMRPETIVPPGCNIFLSNLQGDGTITSSGVIVYNRLGEGLLSVL